MKGTLQTEQRPTSDGRAGKEYVSPEVNISETKDGYLLEAEMPGVSKDGLEVTLDGNEITLVGHRASEVVLGTPLFRERNLADYRRVFELDPAIDTGKIAAKMDQGVLSLTLPKSERVKPRKITVD
ncbi:MAG: Hsp20/alpha crystallin family protein [Verrucomicrobia bacterium]|nr:Hsp20/alpha crystallin family protein [Verrucomicrobiota bacterium]